MKVIAIVTLLFLPGSFVAVSAPTFKRARSNVFQDLIKHVKLILLHEFCKYSPFLGWASSTARMNAISSLLAASGSTG